MARLAMLYAITDEALAQLEAQDIDQMYDYMGEEIEEENPHAYPCIRLGHSEPKSLLCPKPTSKELPPH